MDKGAESYRGFLGGDDRGLAEQVEAYKDGLILYLNGYVNNIFAAEELAENTFFRLIFETAVGQRSPFPPSKPRCAIACSCANRRTCRKSAAFQWSFSARRTYSWCSFPTKT